MLILTESNFKENIQEGLVLVDFFTETCGPCKRLTPILNEIQNIKICKVDASRNLNLSNEYGISAVPTLIFLKDGVEVRRSLGLVSKESIQKVVDELNGTN